jgi:uncharacterized protein (UPF0210 family)
MKIRSVTYFCNPGFPPRESMIRTAAHFLSGAKAAYEQAGYEVQSTRLATAPFPRMLGEPNLDALPRLARELEALIEGSGIGYVAMGPALPEWPRGYEVVPEAVEATRNMFFSGILAGRRRGVDPRAVSLCARIMVECAPIDPNGFANLRFAALANVPSGSPFFPAAYHGGGKPAFAVATEAADLAVQAFTGAPSVEAGRTELVGQIERHAKAIGRVGRQLARRATGVRSSPGFAGIDFSLAPFPEQARSLGTAFEDLGVRAVGLAGSLAAAAILAEAVDRAKFARAGFSGLLLPVLEDATLARRAAEGILSVKDLLLYSAVCGTGLDTLPLPGDATSGQIGALLLDLAALSIRLDKPLTARLLPIPGKQAGDLTNFDFEYFANSRVMALEAEDLREPLRGREPFGLHHR